MLRKSRFTLARGHVTGSEVGTISLVCTQSKCLAGTVDKLVHMKRILVLGYWILGKVSRSSAL